MLLDTLGVCEALPGQDIGRQILNKVEQVGKSRSCLKCFLETRDFQAMPFYKQQGYQVQWEQEGYPKTGCQYFMVKQR
ncbi:GNAT family N-acetyltransferase [Agarivorans sp. QJM3NY_33]|uniref:GNAT family N-acetyltransferase n=1 Tax=Agarivorans sp. QJM3NY_33 TaxID=3421432 RepID=UPI003D7C5290